LLTVAKVKSLKPKGHPYRVADLDGSCKGLGVHVSAKGHKSYSLCSVVSGKRRFYKVGNCDTTTLAEARTRGRKIRRKLERGEDPRAPVDKEMASVRGLYEAYLEDRKRRGTRSIKELVRQMEKDVLPLIGDSLARDIKPQDIADVLRPVVQRKALVQANYIRANLHAMFAWGASADLNPHLPKNLNRFGVGNNPVTPVPKPLRGSRPGNRFLSEKEVRLFWWGLQEYAAPVPMIALRLMLCTGARVREVVELKWSDLDRDQNIWHLERTKNGRAHEIPLNQLAQLQLENIHPFTGHGTVIFPQKSSLHQPTDSTALNNVIRRICPKIEMKRFTPRDLRRTVKSLALKYGASKQDLDLVQNHSLGSDVSTVHYIRYDWLREKQRALNSWNSALTEIINNTSPETPRLFAAAG